MSLNEEWRLKSEIFSDIIPATVPGTVHTDLLEAGLINDPYYRDNALELKSLEKASWVYEKTFELSQNQISKKIDLIFDGLDTYAEVYLNDHLILSADNMFRTWRIPIKEYVREGENHLSVEFTSPLIANEKKANQVGFIFPADNDKDSLKVSPFTRKAAYHFGWDWAPRILTCGIWKPVYLDMWDELRINDIYIHQTKLTTDSAFFTALVEIESVLNELPYEVFVNENKVLFNAVDGIQTLEIPFQIINPKLWWPSGSGDQNLYSIPVRIEQSGRIIDEQEITIGIRTIDLVQKEDSIGTSFYFEVNGVPLFMKGANYIPQDVFLPRVKPKQYRTLLQATKDANMNMIRVWGGGVYERDLFYDLCDSLGLLVWQDFMFACTMYPGDQDFTQNVIEEATQQVRRLRNHPSLALWCGNNEIEVAWNNWGWQEKYGYTKEASEKLWQDYLILFHEVLPDIVFFESPNTDYVSTSPLSNWGTVENFNHSSMHYWGVWHGRDSLEAYRDNVGRFMAEYGMQSYPEMSTIQTFTLPEDLNLNSEVMKNRQKSYIGNGEIFRQVERYYKSPDSFEDFVEKSQEVQAKAMQIAIDAHINSDGHCMGSLLWQLNDCYPGPTWSIIDYYGNKKKAYYTVREAFK
jgi:beta-mannosidase